MGDTMYQKTIAHKLMWEGVGIHSGQMCRVTAYPAPANAGRSFVSQATEIPARSEFVVDTRRCTTLGRSTVRLMTVEHLLSAFCGLGIDNARIDVEGPELPILDGSALPYVEAILAQGITIQEAEAVCMRPQHTVWVREGQSEIRIEPSDRFELSVEVDFETWPEGCTKTSAEIGDGHEAFYAAQVAPARTFAFQAEVEQLLAAGLAKGGSLANALIISPPDRFSSPLRLPMEWAVHKLLDLVGDLALIGARPQMRVTARRPGHTVNTMAAKRMALELPHGLTRGIE